MICTTVRLGVLLSSYNRSLNHEDTGIIRIRAESARFLPNQTVVIPGTAGDGLVTFEVSTLLHLAHVYSLAVFKQSFGQIFHALHCLVSSRSRRKCRAHVADLPHELTAKEPVAREISRL